MLLHLLACGTGPTVPMSPCPGSPNCVSSRSDPTDEEHWIEPMDGAAWPALIRIVEARSDVQVVVATESYRHYTFTTPTLGFVDDLEIQRDGSIVHVRSASRVGHSDLGVNRARVDSLRTAATHGN